MEKSKFNRFFKIIICVIISFSFWTLNKLSKKSNNNISVKVNIVDLPENLALDSLSYKQINLKISGIGNVQTKKKKQLTSVLKIFQANYYISKKKKLNHNLNQI